MPKKSNKKVKSKKIVQPTDLNVGDDKLLEDLKQISLMSGEEVDKDVETNPIVERKNSELEVDDDNKSLENITSANSDETELKDVPKETSTQDSEQEKKDNDTEITESNEQGTPIKEKEEDLSFIKDMIGEENKDKETENVESPSETENKPKHSMTYEEMFGYTWMGY